MIEAPTAEAPDAVGANGQQFIPGTEPEVVPEIINAAKAFKEQSRLHSQSAQRLKELKNELTEVSERHYQDHFWPDPEDETGEHFVYRCGDVEVFYDREVKENVKVNIQEAEELE